ncbi:MAG: hypothetical protein ACQESR_20410 [Planctomycetota bacterium]
MSLHSDLFEKIQRLPEDKQLVVKSLVDQLSRSADESAEESHGDWYGYLEGLKIAISEEQPCNARHEMSGEFPREVNH